MFYLNNNPCSGSSSLIMLVVHSMNFLLKNGEARVKGVFAPPCHFFKNV